MVKEACKKSKDIITDLTAQKDLPDFTKLQTMDKKDKHIILYFSDLWNFIISNLKDNNVQNFISFLLFSRRTHFSIIFEYHCFPFGLPKQANEFFSFFMSNSTLIILTKTLSDQNRLNTFKRRFLHNYIDNFEAAERLSENICRSSKNKNSRSYVALQKDMDQRHRLLRIDIFGNNIINILN